MNKANQAEQMFKKGFNCSQAVLSVFCEEMGLSKKIALKISCGFGGGMRLGEVCGAVTGAIQLLGLKYGQDREDDIESKENTYGIVREFIEKFKEQNGSITCKQLLGCDLSTENGRKYAKDNGFFESVCPKLIKNAVEILEDIL